MSPPGSGRPGAWLVGPKPPGARRAVATPTLPVGRGGRLGIDARAQHVRVELGLEPHQASQTQATGDWPIVVVATVRRYSRGPATAARRRRSAAPHRDRRRRNRRRSCASVRPGRRAATASGWPPRRSSGRARGSARRRREAQSPCARSFAPEVSRPKPPALNVQAGAAVSNRKRTSPSDRRRVEDRAGRPHRHRHGLGHGAGGVRRPHRHRSGGIGRFGRRSTPGPNPG